MSDQHEVIPIEYAADPELARMYVLPHSIEAEQAVIGAAILAGSEVVDDVQVVGLAADRFYRPDHRLAWRALAGLTSEGQVIDILTLCERLNSAGQLEHAGGFAYFTELANMTPSSANAIAYAQIVIERAIERDWIHAADQVRQAMFESGTSHGDRVTRAQEVITEIGSERRPAGAVPIAQALRQYVEHLEWRHDHPGIHGLLTGYRHIDYRLQGLQPGNLLVIGARPGMGKTTYVLNIMRQTATDPESRSHVLVFSLEMSNLELAQRLLAAQGEIQMGLMKSAKVLDHQASMPRLSSAVGVLKDVDVMLDESPGLTVEEIAGRSRREARQRPLDAIIVDHLALVEASNSRFNENDRISHVTRNLKKLAKELGTVVIVLSQLNREVEKRANKRPTCADLRSSGAIEQDADVIQFLYREEVYDEMTAKKGELEVITAKARDGETGTDYLAWRGQYNRIDDKPLVTNREDPRDQFTPA